MSDRRRARAEQPTGGPLVVPERLQRFVAAEWATEDDDRPGEEWAARGARLHRRYSDARKAWADERGLTLAEMRRLIPRREVVDR